MSDRPEPDLAYCIDLSQRLIRTQSLPGQEGELAGYLAGEMTTLGYHDVWTDVAGNVFGRIRGSGAVEPLLFNTHLDHVDVGDHAQWPHPPFDAVLESDRIWGRGAVDIKGPMAAQIVGAARLLHGDQPPGDVIVSCVVQEEIGGVGARVLAASPPARLVVVGEPSRNQVRRGHRGRYELLAHLEGRSVHASVPLEGHNPLFSLARFVSRLNELRLPRDEELGVSTVVPTLVTTDQPSPNVIPAEVRQTLDYRAVPGERVEDAAARLDELLQQCLEPGVTGHVTIPVTRPAAYTGYTVEMPADNPAYLLAPDDPAVTAAAAIAAEALGHPVETGVWRFATDGGHFAAAGMTPIGFGPGDDLLAHTVREHIEIEQLREALLVNEALARELATRSVG